jgi:CRP-like cAMP-binding protein
MNDTDRSIAYLPFLKEMPLFRDLPEAPARFLAGGSLLRNLDRGQILFEKGSRPAGIYCLLGGRIKLSALAADGSERVLELILPGRVFAAAAAVLDEPHPLLAQVLSESRVLQVGRERIHEAMGRWPEVAMPVLDAVARDCFRLIHDLSSCCLLSASQRLVDFLIQEAEAGPGGAGDSARVVLPAAKALVASSLNLTAETFSRELHELARRGLVQVDRRTVHIPSLARLQGRLEPAPEPAGGRGRGYAHGAAD